MISTTTLLGPSNQKINRWTKLAVWLKGEEVALVNEHRCPNCNKWSHETASDKWRYEDPSSDLPFGYQNEVKTCGGCGHESLWFDTGFMGVMGQADDQKHEHGAFWHRLPKDWK